MNGSGSFGARVPMGIQKKPPFFQIGNEVVDVFQPIMGPHCFTVYCHLLRRRFKDPALKHSVRDLASSSGLSGATVLRSLEIIAHLGLIELYRSGGGQASECKLLDSSEAATRLGAQFVGKSLSWELPPDICKRLHFEVKTIKQRQQGKAKTPNLLSNGSRPLPVSQRNAGVSPAIRQRTTRETQAGTHLLQEERRNEECPTPTPSQDGAAQQDKDSPDEDESDEVLKLARDCFTGVMKDMGNHLLNSSRPPVPHLANGAADWEASGWNSLAVERAARRGEVLELVLSARDPEAARRGLEKYHGKWDKSLRKWYACEVRVELQAAERK